MRCDFTYVRMYSQSESVSISDVTQCKHVQYRGTYSTYTLVHGYIYALYVCVCVSTYIETLIGLHLWGIYLLRWSLFTVKYSLWTSVDFIQLCNCPTNFIMFALN